MKQLLLQHLLLQWSPCRPPLPFSPPPFIPMRSPRRPISVSSTPAAEEGLTARERRMLRNERRGVGKNWREEVEDRLLVKPKKRYASWTEELNLDKLSELGHQWWVVRVSRVTGLETANRLARALARTYPNIDFKVYIPNVHVKRKLKNGTYSDKANPLFPGCVFLWCILNKELHDFIRECNGVGGFVGSKVGNTKRQINRPKPVASSDMEAIFQQAKEEQEKADRAFEEEQVGGSFSDGDPDISSFTSSTNNKKSRRAKAQSMKSSSDGGDYGSLVLGSSVRVSSGPFSDLEGCLKSWMPRPERQRLGSCCLERRAW
ncbi:hypothetical protein QJS10_CPA03g01802 [Acorus calamus]|uniref:NusG-like N-terminal domain-containing protein n=1 Tax=Acorus calamus TaxID=4465 RepID=A0AAV9F5V4_ACOCL|nr:hypothetical protein QJS10_CPA03g01802 [Acorus calamus]